MGRSQGLRVRLAAELNQSEKISSFGFTSSCSLENKLERRVLLVLGRCNLIEL